MVIHSGAASSNRKFGNPEDIERFGNLETPKILKGAFGVSVSGLFHFYFLLYFSVSLHLYIFLSLSLSFYFSVLFLSVSKTLAYSLSFMCLKDTSVLSVIYVSQRHKLFLCHLCVSLPQLVRINASMHHCICLYLMACICNLLLFFCFNLSVSACICLYLRIYLILSYLSY